MQQAVFGCEKTGEQPKRVIGYFSPPEPTTHVHPFTANVHWGKTVHFSAILGLCQAIIDKKFVRFFFFFAHVSPELHLCKT